MQSLLVFVGLCALFTVADSRLRPINDDYRTPSFDMEDSDLGLPEDFSPLWDDERIEDYGMAPIFSRLRRDAPKKYCGDQLVKIVKLRCAMKAGRRKRSGPLFSMVKRNKGAALVKKCCEESCSLAEIDATCS